MSKYLGAVVVLSQLLFISIPRCRADDPPTTQPTIEQQQLDNWWADLEKAEPDSSRALLNFAGKPEATVAFLKDHLKPLAISADDVNKLIGDLSSDDDAVWKPAYEKLQYFDPRLAIDLPTLMTDNNEPVARNRLVEILSNRPMDSLQGHGVKLRAEGQGEFNFVDANSSWWGEAKVSQLANSFWNAKPKWTRADRAIVLLEHIGTADAIVILKDMATGHPDAQPTKTAKQALANLGMPVPEQQNDAGDK